MPLGIVSEEDFQKEKTSFGIVEPNEDSDDGTMGPGNVVDDKSIVDEVSIVNKEQWEYIEQRAKVIDQKKGRGSVPEVPNEVRKILAEDSIVSRGDALQLAKALNISPSSVSAYANGATSTASYNEPKESLSTHITAAKENISKKARNRLLMALDNITEDKLKDTKVIDLGNIARYMSAIVKDMEPPVEEKEQKNGPIFQIYAPQFAKEESFETIYSKE